jgi:hypothetical protein
LTLLSGFGLGKAEEIAKTLKNWLPDGEDASTLRPLLFLSMLLIGALFTYISRLFVKGSAEALKEQRAKTIKELQSSLERLERQNQ